MNKKIIAIVAVLTLLVAVGVGLFFFLGDSGEESSRESSRSSQNDDDEDDEGDEGKSLGITGEEMRLEKYLGMVKLESQGKEKEVITGSRLISGDDLTTMGESNAYIVLDQHKILMVDELSNIEIQQEGRELDVKLFAGSVFFNVSEKLEADESLDFHTNNIVTGVRGTSGIITYKEEEKVSQVVVLSGVMEVSSPQDTVVITAGQAAVATTLDDGSVEMKVIAYEREDLSVFFSDFFIDELQLDLVAEETALTLSEKLRFPSMIPVEGKVASLSPLLVASMTTDEIYLLEEGTADLSRMTLGAMVTGEYQVSEGKNVLNYLAQIGQGADFVGAYYRVLTQEHIGTEWMAGYPSPVLCSPTDNDTHLVFDLEYDEILTEGEKEALFFLLEAHTNGKTQVFEATPDELLAMGLGTMAFDYNFGDHVAANEQVIFTNLSGYSSDTDYIPSTISLSFGRFYVCMFEGRLNSDGYTYTTYYVSAAG